MHLIMPCYLLMLLAASALIAPAHAVQAKLNTEGGINSSLEGVNGSSQAGTRPVSYIVRLKQQPIAGFQDDVVEASEAVQVADGSKVDTKTAKVQAYAQSLDAEATATAERAGVAAKIRYRFKYAVNGLAIENPSEQELQQLLNDPNVRSIEKDELKVTFTYGTPKFLGLAGYGKDGAGGAWEKAGKSAVGPSQAGYNVVIGIVDTGIWVENTCFSDRKDMQQGKGAFAYGAFPKPKYNGTCPIGNRRSRVKCNRKVIWCQFFSTALGGHEYVKKTFPDEYNNCRDASGHGSHVAAITAGNYGYTTQFGRAASGMAPKARLAIYKALWGSTGDSAKSSGSTIDIIAAIDKAVADGVDILNLSLGSEIPSATFRDSLQEALMQAARAGVFVSVAGGNSGPDPGTVDHPAPWVTTVAATTHDRTLNVPVEFGNGKTNLGAGTHTDVVGPNAPLVLAANVALGNKTDAQQCRPDSLDPRKTAGKIVVCDRGEIARVLKSQEVKRAGGIGMILLDVEATGTQSGVVAEIHAVPAVHFPQVIRDEIRAYAAKSDATATIYGAILREALVAPSMAEFSSRGPALAGGGTVLKPDIAAPGADIFSAYSPAGRKSGLLYQYMSGTSMASPHIAGIAALLRQMNSKWSPMMIKSALMTTAYTTTRTGDGLGQPFGNAFDYGAGHVNPTKMFNPGLVFDSKYRDWQLFLCGAERQVGDNFCKLCESDPDLCQPYNLNSPSIALPYLFGTTPVIIRRTVTSVMANKAKFVVSADVEKSRAGSIDMKITVSPREFTINPDATQQVSITIQAKEGAPASDYMFGSVQFDGPDDITVRMPVVARVLAV